MKNIDVLTSTLNQRANLAVVTNLDRTLGELTCHQSMNQSTHHSGARFSFLLGYVLLNLNFKSDALAL